MRISTPIRGTRLASAGLFVALCLCILATAGCRSSSQPGSSLGAGGESTTTPASTQQSTIPNFSHVFLIVLENAEYGTVIGNSSAPYLNGLAERAGLATQYFALSQPSLPNYLALIGGSTFGIDDDCVTCYVSSRTLVDQIESSGRTWRAYFESMPSSCYTHDAGTYAVRHNPFVYFDSIRTNAARCATHIVPFESFSSDLEKSSVPNFIWITPNLCHDMHDCDLRTADAWIEQTATTITNSAAFKDNGVLFILWDEGTSEKGCCGSQGGGQIPLMVVRPQGAPAVRSTVEETHYSLLRTIEDAWGLPPLGGAKDARPMVEFFPPN